MNYECVASSATENDTIGSSGGVEEAGQSRKMHDRWQP